VIVAVTGPRRYVDATSFADITTKECLGTGWDDDGHMLVQFAVNLTADEVTRVRLRCVTTDPTTEGLLGQAWTAYQANVGYLAIPAPTQAQIAAQITALTRQLNAVIRLLAPVEV
jgi:hypothetical protein